MRATPFKDGVVALIPQLRAYAAILTRSSTEADDLVQEALVRAWAYRHTFRPGSHLRPWLFQILRTRFYSRIRRPGLELEVLDDRLAQSIGRPATQETRAELHDLLRALDQLGDTAREALLLVCGAGLSYAEAAEICGCPEGTLKSRVNRARAFVIALLSELDLDPAQSPALQASGGRR